jgi:hypothetical protein
VSVLVNLADDTVFEGRENFTLMLQTDQSRVFFSPGLTVVSVVDNEGIVVWGLRRDEKEERDRNGGRERAEGLRGREGWGGREDWWVGGEREWSKGRGGREDRWVGGR